MPGKQRLTFLLIFFVSFFCLRGFAENEFQRRLDQARADNASAQAFSFLANLPEKELTPFVFPVINRNVPSWKEYREAPFEKAWRNYPNVVGAVGESYLSHRAQELVKQNPGWEYVSGADYNLKNRDGGRPDGLLITRTDDTLVIESSLESKMANHYDAGQVYSYMRVWQLVGVTLPNGKHYSPAQIKLRSGEAAVSLASLNLREPNDFKAVEKNVTLFTSYDPPSNFPGKTERAPFSRKELEQLAQKYVAYSWLGERATPERAKEIIKSAPRLPGPPKLKVEFKDPVIGLNRAAIRPVISLSPEILNPPEMTWAQLPPELGGPPRNPHLERSRELDVQLTQYLESQLKFPDKGVLRAYLEKHGGPMFAFTEFLNDTVRNRMLQLGEVPAQESVQAWLKSTPPLLNAKLTRSVVHVLVDKYGQPASADFFRELYRDAPDWKTFLDREPELRLKVDSCFSLGD